jgi:anaerobic ribonucleoside-triphosphate reductase activating protein
MRLYVETISPFVSNLGPGKRIGIWVQGCSLHCPGCISPELAERKASSAREVDNIAHEISELAHGHDGITISGGEPFEQAGPLARLVRLVRQTTNLDILVYSGYSIEDIRAGSCAMRSLLSSIDILIDGRFEVETPNTKVWRGSDNQRMHLLTARAQQYARYADARYRGRRPVHVETTREGKLRIIGIPSRGFVHSLQKKIIAHGLKL